MYRCTSFSDVTDVHMSQMFRCTSFFICHNYIFGDTYVSDTYRRIQKDISPRTGTCTFGKLRTFLCSTYQHSKTRSVRTMFVKCVFTIFCHTYHVCKCVKCECSKQNSSKMLRIENSSHNPMQSPAFKLFEVHKFSLNCPKIISKIS